MASSSYVDRRNDDDFSQRRGFLTPPPKWRMNHQSPPVMPMSEMKSKARGDAFHIIHKIPSGDSPYVRAKHVQLVEKDPSRAISLFWAAINAGDRVDSALKDMAVVMKQLNRSDEAVEAIKSFRHLSPPESQESIDNILVELFKQSGRIEEEIELLQYKLKQVEEGMAFSGRKTKLARSQGKKIQITVQKEYSRLLGNLAWAFMQRGDFKSAEEHYRKALSFEADKNKQCNLAVCLMHMNKLTEAKFLLQTIPSVSGAVDELYAKSYERASEILAEFESQRVPRPTKQMDKDNESGTGMVKGFADGSTMNNGAYTGFAYEKKAGFDWRTSHHEGVCSSSKRDSEFSCRDIPRVPLTQPRRCPRSGDQTKTETPNGGHCRKLSFANQNVNYSAGYSAPDEMPKIFPHFLEKSHGGDEKKNDEGMNSLPSESTFPADSGKLDEASDTKLQISTREYKKSWADMVEEDEQESGNWKNDYYYSQKPSFSVAAMNQEEVFDDENLDSNIVAETPKLLHDLTETGGGYLTQPHKTEQSKSQPLRRSLCFDQNRISGLPKLGCSSPSPLATKVLDFEGQDGNHKNWRRLQVFKDITRDHGSPRC